MQILLIRTMDGFAPADDEAAENMKRFKIGSVAMMDVRLMRNGAFFRKWWALVKLGFEHFEEASLDKEYKGQKIKPDFERFRKDITILAGFYRPVWNVKGEMRIEAESISFGSMTEERFTKLYDATIQVLLQKVFNGERVKKWTETELRSLVDQISRF